MGERSTTVMSRRDASVSQAEPAPSGQAERIALERVAERLVGRSRRVRVGRFDIGRQLGRGAFGAVYSGHDPELGREVALKLLVSEHLRDRAARDRLVREAQALARVSHPNVVEIFDVGVEQHRNGPPTVYVVMELLRGVDLQTWMAEDPPPAWPRIVEVFLEAGRGLAAAHECGVVHRDFKPANVMLTDDGRVKVIDFGLAIDDLTSGTTAESLGSGARSRSDAFRITEIGTVVGTPGYMSPEQHSGKPELVGPATDQYALCVSLYEALFGRRPFVAGSIADLAVAKYGPVTIPDSARRRIPTEVTAAIVRGLAPEPSDRWPSVTALLAVLEPALGRPSRGRRRAAFAGLGCLGLVVVAAGRPDPSDTHCRAVARHHAELLPADREAAIRRRLMSEQGAVGADPWTRIRDHIDAQTQQWQSAFDHACAAGDQETLSCLDAWTDHADATFGVLAEADRTAALRAVDIVRAIPDVARCSDERDRGPVASAGPTHSRDLAQARAWLHAGRGDEAARLAEDILERARATGDRRAVAYASLTAGLVAAERERLELGRALLFQSAEAANAEGLDVVAVEAEAALVRLHGAMGDFDEARRWAHVADAHIASAGRPDFMERWLLNARAFALIYEGDYETAYDLSAELASRSPLDEVPLIRGKALANQAMAAFELGRIEQARALNDEAIEILGRQLGAGHPSVARMRADAGRYACAAGDLQTGIELLRTGIEVLEEFGGPTDPYALNAKRSLAINLAIVGRQDEALALLEGVYDATRQLYGATHVRTAVTAFALADAYLKADRPDDAMPPTRDAIAALTELYGAGSERLVEGQELMARILLRSGDLSAARDVAERAMLGLDPDDPSQRENAINLLLVRAQIEESEGHIDAAIRVLEQGRDLCRSDPSSADPSMLAVFESNLAFLRADRGDREGAAVAATAALEHLQRIGAPAEEMQELAELRHRMTAPR